MCLYQEPPLKRPRGTPAWLSNLATLVDRGNEAKIVNEILSNPDFQQSLKAALFKKGKSARKKFSSTNEPSVFRSPKGRLVSAEDFYGTGICQMEKIAPLLTDFMRGLTDQPALDHEARDRAVVGAAAMMFKEGNDCMNTFQKINTAATLDGHFSGKVRLTSVCDHMRRA
jgi:hypothetical protein